MIQMERIQFLNSKDAVNGKYVLYWMQASQRAGCNHALEYAIRVADERAKPLVVFFGITDQYPEANERHFTFMLEGLKETQAALAERGILMVVRSVSPEKGVQALAADADLVVVDRGYLRIQRQWRSYAAKRLTCSLIQVESDVVVPVETTSLKEEYSAATLRRKIEPMLDGFILPLSERSPRHSSLRMEMESEKLSDIGSLIQKLRIDGSVKASPLFCGGTAEANARLNSFVTSKLDEYDTLRNNPSVDFLSGLSPYLHFGQISPLKIALAVRAVDSPGVAAFLEELIVRRELSINFIHYNEMYDSFNSLPVWARRSLHDHEADAREYLYADKEWENAETHDLYWNAAQEEMLVTGKMHGYMRMYWGKKILEWSATPEQAFQTALFLNNKYELDGRDPNGYTGVAWCFGKHDRGWPERPVFGKVRYMNANGLKRKFDADAYVDKIKRMKKTYASNA